MVIAGFLCALFGLVLFFIPVLAPILALVGLILSIVALRKRKDEKNKGLSIAGIVIAAIAIILSIVYTIGLIMSIMNNASVVEKVAAAGIQSEFSEIQSEINLAIAQEMALDENATTKDIVKEKIALREERNIVYDKASFELLPEVTKNVLKDKVAIKDSGKTYYKIDDTVVSFIVDTDVYVIDEEGKVYVNTILQNIGM